MIDHTRVGDAVYMLRNDALMIETIQGIAPDCTPHSAIVGSRYRRQRNVEDWILSHKRPYLERHWIVVEKQQTYTETTNPQIAVLVEIQGVNRRSAEIETAMNKTQRLRSRITTNSIGALLGSHIQLTAGRQPRTC